MKLITAILVACSTLPAIAQEQKKPTYSKYNIFGISTGMTLGQCEKILGVKLRARNETEYVSDNTAWKMTFVFGKDSKELTRVEAVRLNQATRTRDAIIAHFLRELGDAIDKSTLSPDGDKLTKLEWSGGHYIFRFDNRYATATISIAGRQSTPAVRDTADFANGFNQVTDGVMTGVLANEEVEKEEDWVVISEVGVDVPDEDLPTIIISSTDFGDINFKPFKPLTLPAPNDPVIPTTRKKELSLFPPGRAPFNGREVFEGGPYEHYNVLSRVQILRKVQRQLKAGVPDGRMGKNTQKAILSYQRNDYLPLTGRLDEETLKSLGLTNLPEIRPANRNTGKTPDHEVTDGNLKGIGGQVLRELLDGVDGVDGVDGAGKRAGE